ASLFKAEADEFVGALRREYPNARTKLTSEGGNIFVREDFKFLSREQILNDAANRKLLLHDVIGPLAPDVIESSALYQLCQRHKPDIIIDSINSATALAYQDIYSASQETLGLLEEAAQTNALPETLVETAEKLLATQYTPQLIRHVQLLHEAMRAAQTKFYLKIGTCGTGGMGLNIPYTHSEDKPSRMLLSKSAMAGAHTLLLFLMGRTPDAPIIKEIKPAAAIAWKKIGFGAVKVRGKEVELEDSLAEEGLSLAEIFSVGDLKKNLISVSEKKVLTAPYIDTGENGIFSLAEFQTLTDEGQMEFVTPEEIAQNIVWEIKGRNTGKDIVNALDTSVMGPTYRAGFLRERAIEELQRLEHEHGIDSVAFEMLGPPRLSKLLYEIYLLKKVCKTFGALRAAGPEFLSDEATRLITTDRDLRSRILSIGIPILLPDGLRLLRGSTMKIPAKHNTHDQQPSPENLEHWTHDGWVDLRLENMKRWQTRIENIFNEVEHAETHTSSDTSSRFVRNAHYWTGEGEINIGKVVGWLFITEDDGLRMKG
ncbi:MAG: short-chain dehydrogenase, partial [Rhizobacter sp.]|nr:short-chain dehydrogenase [Chlorobiales bacterium]